MSKKLENTRVEKYTHRKKRNKKRLLLYILIPLLIVLLGGGAFAAHIYSTAKQAAGNSYEDVGRNDEISDLRDAQVNPVEDNVSVLIMGVDDSEEREFGGKSRTDALMLATFNKKEHDVKLLSIPRDTYVYIPETEGYDKITHAHFYGGPKATIETVEKFLNVPVDYYTRVDFNAFIDVVDILNGIDYDVPYEIEEMDSNDKKDAIHLMPGEQTLDGEGALALARTRKYDSDVERGKRQQEIIKKIADKTISASNIMKIDDLITSVSDNVKTNLKFDDIKSFVSYGIDKNVSIETVNLEGDGAKREDGIWYYNVEPESRADVQKELREHLNLTDDEDYDPYEGVVPYDNTFNPDVWKNGEYDEDEQYDQGEQYDPNQEDGWNEENQEDQYDQGEEYNQDNDNNQGDGEYNEGEPFDQSGEHEQEEEYDQSEEEYNQ